MAYCPRCGVEVEDRLDSCPLCDIAIPAAARKDPDAPADYPENIVPPRALYRQLTDLQKRRVFRGMMGFLILFPIGLTLLLDISMGDGVSWSYMVVVPMVGAGVVGWILVRYARRIVPAVTGVLAVGTAVLVLLEMPRAVRAGNWTGALTHSAILPYLVVSAVAAELFLVVATRRALKRSSLLALLGLVAVLLTVAIDAISVGPAGVTWTVPDWSLVVASAVLPVVFYLVYIGYVRRRGLNMGGFFFLDAAVMLLAIDLSTSVGLGWSLVTGVVLVPIAVVLYTLHVALFNDTDWRKALHL